MEMKLSEPPVFSIIVPVYNVEDYLKKCLDSIVNQTFKNIEIIAVDDGSTDSSLDICNEFTKRHENFRVYTKKNEGQGVARNYGLERASGKYICFVDSDDWIEPDLCADTHGAMDVSKADFLNFGLDFFSHSGKILKKIDQFMVEELTGVEIFYQALLDDQILSSPCNKVYRRQFINDHAIRFPRLRVNEDVYFSRAISHVASKTIFVSKTYYHALVRPNSTTRSMNVASFNATADLINFERKQFLHEESDKSLEGRFHAHTIKLLSYLLIQAAFRIEHYSEYIACFEVAQRCGFSEYSSNPDVMIFLKKKNRLMVKICSRPLILRSMATFLKAIKVSPY